MDIGFVGVTAMLNLTLCLYLRSTAIIPSPATSNPAPASPWVAVHREREIKHHAFVF